MEEKAKEILLSLFKNFNNMKDRNVKEETRIVLLKDLENNIKRGNKKSVQIAGVEEVALKMLDEEYNKFSSMEKDSKIEKQEDSKNQEKQNRNGQIDLISVYKGELWKTAPKRRNEREEDER